LQVLFGDTPPPVLFGAMTVNEMVSASLNGAAIRIMVDCSKLPDYLKKEVGTGFNGGHAWTLVGCKVETDGRVWFLIYDPMGKPWENYAGKWAPWVDFDQAVEKNSSGKPKVTLAYREAAVPPPPTPESEALVQIAQIVEDTLS
jgi:hypothetical protein